MCGIVGIVGKTDVAQRLFDGLKRLEYRGYDSAGICTIEDGAFIGSNSSLVAPVTIGREATIGAGSVITKDAPEGELTVARGRQVSVPGWRRPGKKT